MGCFTPLGDFFLLLSLSSAAVVVVAVVGGGTGTVSVIDKRVEDALQEVWGRGEEERREGLDRLTDHLVGSSLELMTGKRKREERGEGEGLWLLKGPSGC